MTNAQFTPSRRVESQQCKLDSRRLTTAADGKFANRTRSGSFLESRHQLTPGTPTRQDSLVWSGRVESASVLVLIGQLLRTCRVFEFIAASAAVGNSSDQLCR